MALPKNSTEAWRAIHEAHAAHIEAALMDAEPENAAPHAEAMKRIEDMGVLVDEASDAPPVTQADKVIAGLHEQNERLRGIIRRIAWRTPDGTVLAQWDSGVPLVAKAPGIAEALTGRPIPREEESAE